MTLRARLRTRGFPLLTLSIALAPTWGCEELGDFIEEASGTSDPDMPVAEPQGGAEAEDEALPPRPADSIAHSETDVITFRSILESSEMSRAERIRAFENLDPGALQKRVAEPNVRGAPAAPTPTRRPSATTDTQPEPKTNRTDVPIVMYSTSWCGVCKRARKYFQERGIAFTEYDVDENVQARNEYLLLNPRRSVPTLKIGNQVVVGFSPASVEAAIRAEGG